MTEKPTEPVKFLLLRNGDEGYSVDKFPSKEALENFLRKNSYIQIDNVEVYEVEPYSILYSVVPTITLPEKEKIQK